MKSLSPIQHNFTKLNTYLQVYHEKVKGEGLHQKYLV